jgi:hypothetical protein
MVKMILGQLCPSLKKKVDTFYFCILGTPELHAGETTG